MSFYEDQKVKQIEWWKLYSNQPNWDIEVKKWGWQNNVSYPHIVKGDWKKLLWKGIEKELPKYLGNIIQAHSGTSNLLSSWVACANLYFPSNFIKEFRMLLTNFLKEKISCEIEEVVEVELEYSLDGNLSPKELLGEMEGGRGSGQTSPDVAFVVRTPKGIGLILTECKYTEHSFYSCSARKKNKRRNKPSNPAPEKCLTKSDYRTIPCHQHVWGRKYFDHFQLSIVGQNKLNRCPASTAGYQLFRQQALANGIYKSGKYVFVYSSVSFDERNKPLISCLKKTGIPDFQIGWSEIYEHSAEFITWHHQDWVNFVRKNSIESECIDWLKYLNKRYGY